MEISTERLILRPLSIKDAESVFEYASDKETTKFMLWGCKNTIDEVKDFLTNSQNEWQKDFPNFYEFAITVDGKQIGAISAYLNESKTEAELGWILNKLFQGKGYATEAALAIKTFLKNELHIKKIIAHCDEKNKASLNVMKKIGMKIISCGTERIYPLTNKKSTELMCSCTL